MKGREERHQGCENGLYQFYQFATYLRRLHRLQFSGLPFCDRSMQQTDVLSA